MTYNHYEIENKWNKKWSEDNLYRTDESNPKKHYVLDMFPYPSGAGLHVGHPKGYIATDIYSRYKRMNGFSVLHPMGWDAFGLPAENYAIKNKIHPKVAIDQNIATYKSQLQKIGFMYDWEREINTTDPAYFKWTQWAFIQMFKKGLAYESYEPINWCPSCKTGLANEDLENGVCERCSSEVEQKKMRQWVIRITDYADRLLEGLDTLNWPASIKESQKNWIGRSEGSEFAFNLHFTRNPEVNKNRDAEGNPARLNVFTTRPDTLFGVTFMVLAPEHPWVLLATDEKHDVLENKEEVKKYLYTTSQKTEIERMSKTKEKTGVELKGVVAINPANGQEVKLFVADYVIGAYGTGAVMGVPAHDSRDFEFAKKFGIDIKWVITNKENNNSQEEAFEEYGVLINSDSFNGLSSKEAQDKITEAFGKKRVTYKIKDWVFARQRYWGEPIPIVHCEKCGAVAVPENQLPLTLPDVEFYEPTDTGESPLANISEWVNTTCPTCEGAAKRETNTMPQWAGSSWYYLRYIDPHNDTQLIDAEKEKKWMPVDVYVGGAEHATRHLIYARFWHKFLFDEKVVSTNEPFMRLEHVGLIIGPDGRKMSKRYGNVINPDVIVETVGADALRLYEMFMGPFSQSIAWDLNGIAGSRRFIERFVALSEKVSETEGLSDSVVIKLNQVIKKVGEDIQEFKFNTAISSMMELLNSIEKDSAISKNEYSSLIQIIAPFAPYISEELWSKFGSDGSVHTSKWPSYDPEKLIEDTVVIAIQINGKVRDEIEVKRGVSQSDIEETILNRENVIKWIKDSKVVKKIYVQDKIFNIVANID